MRRRVVNFLRLLVLETAHHVASFPISSTPLPYDQVKNQCKALVTGKQQKMSALQSFKLSQEAKAILLCSDIEKKSPFFANEHEVYSPNLDFLEENDDEVAD